MKYALVFCLILFLPAIQAATIEGEIYTFLLEEVENAVVSIDTEPRQVLVSKDGKYSFHAPEGNYKISAWYESKQETYEWEEEISIKEEGTYTLDLILLPIEESSIEEDMFSVKEETSKWWWLLIVPLVGILMLALRRKKEEAEEIINDEAGEIKELIAFLKTKDGRATQKEIRKAFPFSEAKISLLLTQLESEEKIKKIKRGRTNIIILNDRKEY